MDRTARIRWRFILVLSVGICCAVAGAGSLLLGGLSLLLWNSAQPEPTGLIEPGKFGTEFALSMALSERFPLASPVDAAVSTLSHWGARCRDQGRLEKAHEHLVLCVPTVPFPSLPHTYTAIELHYDKARKITYIFVEDRHEGS